MNKLLNRLWHLISSSQPNSNIWFKWQKFILGSCLFCSVDLQIKKGKCCSSSNFVYRYCIQVRVLHLVFCFSITINLQNTQKIFRMMYDKAFHVCQRKWTHKRLERTDCALLDSVCDCMCECVFDGDEEFSTVRQNEWTKTQKTHTQRALFISTKG